MPLSENQIIELSDFYMKEYDLKHENLNNLKEVLKQRGNNHFYIFRYISFVKDFLKLSKNKQFTIEIPIRKLHFSKKVERFKFFHSSQRKENG